MPKIVPESKFSEWKGLDRIGMIAHEMKCIWRELTKDDFGIDGEIEVVVPKPDGKGYQATGGIIKIQAKSGASYIVSNTPTSFSARGISKDDLELWYKSNYPIIYIIYHPEDDKLYWKDVKSYIKTAPNVWHPPFKIDFGKLVDEFTPSCLPRLQEIAGISSPRVSLNQKERLFSNLLRLQKWPEKVWSAPCQAKRREDIWKNIRGFTPPFIVVNQSLYTFSNLYDEDCVFRDYYDTENIIAEPSEAFWEDEVRCRHYIQLLNQTLTNHLRRSGIRYEKVFRRYYFAINPNETKEEYKERWFNIITGRTSSRTVARYYQYGYDKFWRHLAADLSFRKIGKSWFLQIIPKYFFTKDGIIPFDSNKVGSYTTRKKAQETNQHVRNHVLFWSDALAGLNSQAIIAQIKLDPVSDDGCVIAIERRPAFAIAEFSIPYDPASYDETEDIKNLSFFDLFGQPDEDEDEDVY
jgi:hypothetical protein